MDFGTGDYEDPQEMDDDEFCVEGLTQDEIAIRSITNEGFSKAIAEKFHLKRNKRDLETENLNAIRSITDDQYSASIAREQYLQRNKRDFDAENMLAIRSITDDTFDPTEIEKVVAVEEVVTQDYPGSFEEEEVLTAVPSESSPVESNVDNSLKDQTDDISSDELEEGPDPGLGQTVADHYNQKINAGVEIRNQSRIVYMRNFNNWMKSMLIEEFLEKCKSVRRAASLKVLDMGSGKGGDMLKWKIGGVGHVIFADIANQSIEDCKIRYADMKKKEEAKIYNQRKVFSAEFIAVDCSKESLRPYYEDKVIELDLVSCQFCIHYSFESVQQARCMLKNAAECLRVGGYFVGTVPDSNQIMARRRLAKSDSFGNDVYQIKCLFDINEPIPLFGSKYDFNLEGVVNCPEFLVHFDLFEKLAAEFGLQLKLRENFKAFYERKSKDVSGSQLLRKMSAFESYPPKEGVKLLGDDSKNDYSHVIKYLEEDPTKEKLGTLSRSEWEAITLYQVFAFEKVEGTEFTK